MKLHSSSRGEGLRSMPDDAGNRTTRARRQVIERSPQVNVTQSIVLACGNPLRGDDGVACLVACTLQDSYAEPNTEIRCAQQWTPELAEPLGNSQLAIFVDASASVPGGELRLEEVTGNEDFPGTTTHSLRPGQVLALARALYQSEPERAFLLTIGGQSFEHGDHLSGVVRRAIPLARSQIKAILAGVELSENGKRCGK